MKQFTVELKKAIVRGSKYHNGKSFEDITTNEWNWYILVYEQNIMIK